MIELSYRNAMADRVGADHGLTPVEIDHAIAESASLYAGVQSELRSGSVPFLSMLDDDTLGPSIKKLVRPWTGRISTLLHIGIGGSGLGPLALHTALVRYEKRHGVDAHFLDNVDPVEIGHLLDRLDLKKTLVHVVTKSGETAETLSAFMIFVRALKKALGKSWTRRVMATTDPERGFLREFAQENSLATCAVPPGVGGRFSVLSPVGLVPMAVCGVDVGRILKGARAMALALTTSSAAANPAFVLALLHYLLDQKRGKKVCVMMPYAEQLKDIAQWFAQLWAESLGKKHATDGSIVHTGQTPVAAMGTTDQHSLLQLINEGPNDKMVTLLAVERPSRDIVVPRDGTDHPATSYLGGKRLGAILEAERLGTEAAMTSHHRPNLTLTLPSITPESVGAMLVFMEMQTLYAGRLYRVDPFDQPGVEEGKRIACGLLGRKGYPAVPEVNRNAHRIKL